MAKYQNNSIMLTREFASALIYLYAAALQRIESITSDDI